MASRVDLAHQHVTFSNHTKAGIRKLEKCIFLPSGTCEDELESLKLITAALVNPKKRTIVKNESSLFVMARESTLKHMLLHCSLFSLYMYQHVPSWLIGVEKKKDCHHCWRMSKTCPIVWDNTVAQPDLWCLCSSYVGRYVQFMFLHLQTPLTSGSSLGETSPP